LKIPSTEKGWWSDSSGRVSEFKPQHCQNKTKLATGNYILQFYWKIANYIEIQYLKTYGTQLNQHFEESMYI
jgi:hypothetical protein